MDQFVVKRGAKKAKLSEPETKQTESQHVDDKKEEEKEEVVVEKKKEHEKEGGEKMVEEEKQVENKENIEIVIPTPFSSHMEKVTAWFLNAANENIPGTEIEGKIGNFTLAGFESAVPGALFNTQLARCKRAATAEHLKIFEKSEIQTTVTFLFANGVRGTQYSDQSSEFVRKRRVSSLDFSFAKKKQDGPSIRLSYNVETACKPPCDVVKMVRLRQRESFFYKGTWRFDFTFVRQGATKAEAKLAPLQHEIELEYIGNLNDSNTVEQARYNVTSMLLKLHDLTVTNGGMNTVEPIALTLLQHIVKED